MKVAVMGCGYVGLTTSVCLASKGHEVECVDVDEEKVEKINNGEPPIYEEGMRELLNEVLEDELLNATLNAGDAVSNSEVVFICVGTPSKSDGGINLKYVREVSKMIGENLNNYKVIVVKSTVVPGTTEGIVRRNLEESGEDFGLCMNPEFLKEGHALNDFLNADRIVLGVSDERTEKVMKRLYADFPREKFVTTPTTAEMIKYANNSLLATKISFANELGNLCKKLNIDSYEVMNGVGLDERLNREFLNSGAGFGGSCFPKDVKAIINKGEGMNVSVNLLKETIEVNEEQPNKMLELLKKHVNPVGKKIGILGLAFKPGTDDIRESPSLKIINELLRLKSEVVVYDPKAMNNVKQAYQNRIGYAENAGEVVDESEAVLIVTAWDEFKKPELYKDAVVIDGRRVLEAKEESRIYEGLCW